MRLMCKIATGTYSVAFVTICILGGCSNEASQRTESPRTVAVPQTASSQNGKTQTGEELFRQFCSNCHPDGGNVSDPNRSLHGSVLKANYITKPDDIVKIMRKPMSRMIRFDPGTISDKDARTIAQYVLDTFR
ncbi:MAG: c-type cytochrome [Desulfuromonadales bacterium]